MAKEAKKVVRPRTGQSVKAEKWLVAYKSATPSVPDEHPDGLYHLVVQYEAQTKTACKAWIKANSMDGQRRLIVAITDDLVVRREERPIVTLRPAPPAAPATEAPAQEE